MTAAEEIRRALHGCAAVLRGLQPEVADHTDVSPEIEAAESAAVRVADLQRENEALRKELGHVD